MAKWSEKQLQGWLERRRISGYAHNRVKDAIRSGTLPRPTSRRCTDCGKKADRYDHRDYTKPLDVDPVCRRCNRARGPAIFSNAQEQ